MGVFVDPMATGIANLLKLNGIRVHSDFGWGRRLYLTCIAAAVMAVRVGTSYSPREGVQRCHTDFTDLGLGCYLGIDSVAQRGAP